ncbi:hypothetical protein IFR05_008474 [Cadophora sp. M221]|nr:hypothetical protein IFR05_008474 [Cadophora sp. M221]
MDVGRNSVAPSCLPQTFQSHIADKSKYPNPTVAELRELEKLELEKLVRFCRAPPRLRRPAKKSILPSACIIDMLDSPITPIFQFSDLPRDIRLMIFDELDAPKPRDVHVALVNIVPRGAHGFKLYYKPINTTVPAILQICHESRSHGLTRYKPAFNNVDQDGNVEDRIYVNPKLDAIIFELPIEIMRYPRTHKLFKCTNFKFAHGFSWVGIEDLDDAFGYDYRFKSYLVISPKGRAAEWVENVQMEPVKPATGWYTCTMIGPVILPPSTDVSAAALPGSW